MANAYITEYAELTQGEAGYIIQAGLEPAKTIQKVAFTATPGQSAAFNDSTKFIRIYSDTAGFILFGDAPTATTAQDTPIAAATAEYFGVKSGQKVSIVT
jgi:hypothetical protein